MFGSDYFYWVTQKLPQVYTVIAYIHVLWRLRDLQYIFAVTYETLCINITNANMYYI